jgi:hypothetical protein
MFETVFQVFKIFTKLKKENVISTPDFEISALRGCGNNSTLEKL